MPPVPAAAVVEAAEVAVAVAVPPVVLPAVVVAHPPQHIIAPNLQATNRINQKRIARKRRRSAKRRI